MQTCRRIRAASGTYLQNQKAKECTSIAMQSDAYGPGPHLQRCSCSYQEYCCHIISMVVLLCALLHLSLGVKGLVSTSAPNSMLALCQGQANMRASIRSSAMIPDIHSSLPAAFAVPCSRCSLKSVNLSGRQGGSLDTNNVPTMGTPDPVWQTVLQRAAFQLGAKPQEVCTALLGRSIDQKGAAFCSFPASGHIAERWCP